MFNIGDKVKIKYISDGNPHNNKIGTVKYLHRFNFYSMGNILAEPETRTQGEIHYDDGTFEIVQDMYRKGSGVVSPIELVKKANN